MFFKLGKARDGLFYLRESVETWGDEPVMELFKGQFRFKKGGVFESKVDFGTSRKGGGH